MKPTVVGEAFDVWVKDRKTEVDKYKPNRKYPVFLFAAEGGRSRAAYMTTLVLETLRQSCPDANPPYFPDHRCFGRECWRAFCECRGELGQVGSGL